MLQTRTHRAMDGHWGGVQQSEAVVAGLGGGGQGVFAADIWEPASPQRHTATSAQLCRHPGERLAADLRTSARLAKHTLQSAPAAGTGSCTPRRA